MDCYNISPMKDSSRSNKSKKKKASRGSSKKSIEYWDGVQSILNNGFNTGKLRSGLQNAQVLHDNAIIKLDLMDMDKERERIILNPADLDDMDFTIHNGVAKDTEE